MLYACKMHLPGNCPCPYPALYRVAWLVASRSIVLHPRPSPLSVSRDVCIDHLARAVDDAIESGLEKTGPLVTLVRSAMTEEQ